MLGTNLSEKMTGHEWTTDTTRLILMDRKDFHQIGVGVDDLIDAYVQTCLSVIAIDKLAQRLINQDCPNPRFDYDLFSVLNPDEALLTEMYKDNFVAR